jgi:hypothetical protein
MKFITRWLPKLKSGKESSTEPPPLNRLAAAVYIGVLILMGTGATLAITDALPKKGVTRELDPAELKVRKMQEDAAPVESKPANPDLPTKTTSAEGVSGRLAR